MAGVGSHIGNHGEGAVRRQVNGAVAVAIEMMSEVRPAGIGRELGRSSGHQQASVAQKGVPAAEQIEVWQMRNNQCLRATVEPRRMVEIMRPRSGKIVVVATK
jgi:hypothetical protein